MLRAKSFDLLAKLASRPGHLFPKQVLLDEIWAGRAVTDDVISGCIREIRAAIGDDARAPRYIETVSGIGYRFLVKALRAPAAAQQAGHSPASTGQMPWRDGPTVAVLPFFEPGMRHHYRHAAALRRDLVNGLARTRWLTVAASASCEQLGGQPADAAARKLGVRYVVEGEIVPAGQGFSLDVSLSDMETERVLWAERIRRDCTDVVAVMEDVCAEVVVAVESEIEIAERRRALLSPVRNLDAWTGFHRGMSLLQGYDPGSHEDAEQCLRVAARADPACARVAAARSWLHWQQAFLCVSENRKDSVARATDFAAESVALDCRDPISHWAAGRAAWFDDGFEAATRSLSRAVDLNPSFAIGHYSLGYSLCMQRCVETAIAHTATALRLSPFDPIVFTFHALNADLQYQAGNHAAALVEARAAAAHPNVHPFGLAVAAWVSELCGHRDEATGHLTKALRLSSDYSRRSYFAAIRGQYSPEKRREIEGAFDRLGF